MASFPVMSFLISLLLPSMLTEGMVLKQTQKESTISADHVILLISCQHTWEQTPWGLHSCQFDFRVDRG
ncbi:exocrine gland-secreting peptide 24 precursor [Mus musculus]|uniref:Exocrine gland secreted peptide 24 n=1 Tax=Mus musculus TaxID=10090 RepID=A8R0V6_MOUSE|nr:exocrine gland-secreting peptide 24 precursor [Mus musculus]BAF92739.1 exocrine gland-secreting peptide 24 [Mus musculus]|eukprot:NP_001242979.1 exocrine gland-secreting peptide 24 precursor [Mus musculus]